MKKKNVETSNHVNIGLKWILYIEKKKVIYPSMGYCGSTSSTRRIKSITKKNILKGRKMEGIKNFFSV